MGGHVSYLLYHPDRPPLVGDSLADVVLPLIVVDHARRCVWVGGVMDTVAIGPDYSTPDEFAREAALRGLALLSRRGWALFTRR
jgi:hypothetical protein